MITRRSIAVFAGACALATGLLGAHAVGASAYPTTNTAPATRYAFQSFASPHDPTFTQLLGINDHDLIAGYDGSGQTPKTPNKGFTLTLPGHFSAENVPRSAQTQVIAINNAGATGGFYVNNAGKTHGFLDMGGKFQTIVLPGTSFNQILGLNNSGMAAGYFQDGAGINHAYIRDAHGFFTVPPIPNSQATGINDQGVVIGFTQPTTATSSGFIWKSNAVITIIDYPESSFTQPLGENNQGQIVGQYNDAAGKTHGFSYKNGVFSAIDYPGASATTVNGINNAGRIVGFYTNPKNHDDTIGFVGKPVS